jgi:phosphatidylinositol-4,5-bisphosphate 3-kinase
VINSKKKPFGLTFKNTEPLATELIHQLFNVGDDLRHNQLTLQTIKVMDHL